MAREPKDQGRSQPDQASGPSPRPHEPKQPIIPLDRADMVSVAADANQRFRANSERMQADAALKRADEEQSLASTNEHPDQDQDTPSPSSREVGDESDQARDAPERRLSFVKDHARGARAELKAEQAKENAKALTFVKDQEQDQDIER